VRVCILLHGKRHPRDLGTAGVVQFLTYLAVKGHVFASMHNQALNALMFQVDGSIDYRSDLRPRRIKRSMRWRSFIGTCYGSTSAPSRRRGRGRRS
jgi:hypothetical protein